MGERSHQSIGEVLSLLHDEFPDITISKIRFLESQGLIDPERTPSGYRKFYEADIERLRWILRQQREHFLPLKVIKGRLERGELDEPPPSENGAAAPAEAAPDRAGPAAEEVPEPVDEGLVPEPDGQPLQAERTSVSMTRDELAAAAGLSPEDLGALESYGLIAGHAVGRETAYDDAALLVARLAAGFRSYGVEPRHLRMYKVAAEREAGFFEQVIMPLMKQRNPTARQQALDTLRQLASLGQSLHAAMLRSSLRQYTERG